MNKKLKRKFSAVSNRGKYRQNNEDKNKNE